MEYRPQWSSSQDALLLRTEMNRLFKTIFGDQSPWQGPSFIQGSWPSQVDIYEVPDAFVVRAELPGFSVENLTIEINDDRLSIKGERPPEKQGMTVRHWTLGWGYGAFEYSFILPNTVDREHVQATYRDGVLELRLPKREPPQGWPMLGGYEPMTLKESEGVADAERLGYERIPYHPLPGQEPDVVPPIDHRCPVPGCPFTVRIWQKGRSVPSCPIHGRLVIPGG